ncbi:MAG: hypothetical protein RLZZ387_4074 [Chloroflexota bacterium]|jgi:shikimate kinase
MMLTLIGMSGAGKSFWAAKFATQGFVVIDCDALLTSKLQSLVGESGSCLEQIGRWMGFPYQADFPRREALYLTCEMAILTDVIAQAKACAASQTNCLIDTGGSIIYADRALLQELRQYSIMIYLRIPQRLHQQMLNSYLEQPRPLIWNGLFEQAANESLSVAFARSYARLLRLREQQYEQWSDVVLEYDYYRQATLSVEQLVEDVWAAAEQARAKLT